MKLFITNLILKFLLLLLCKIDKSELRTVPRKGPFILVGNHINFLDAPVILSALYPRKVVSLVKQETFEKPFLRFLFKTWGSISVNRGTADFSALSRSINVLKDNNFLAIAPEGTRTKNGILIQGHPGIIAIALRAGTPIIPIVYYGNERFFENFKKIKRTKIKIRVGQPFRLSMNTNQPARDERQKATDEIMYQISKLLPENYRGYYSDFSKVTTDYLVFVENILVSNESRWQKIANAILKYFSPTKISTE